MPPAFAQIVAFHNAGLAQGVAELETQGIDAEIVDMHRISVEIDTDPRTFGLNPAYMNLPLVLGIGSQPEWDEAAQDWVLPANPLVAGVDPDRVAFMDYLHPSSATHGVLGSFAAASVTDNTVFRGDEDDFVWTYTRDDLVLAGGGRDRVFTGGGADIVLAGLGDDFVWAGTGRDIVAGGAGDDRLHGASGNDVVAGSDGDDVAFGGGGRDLMVDGLGHDLILAGVGNDAILYAEAAFLGGSNGDDGGCFDGGRGFDTLYLALDDATRAAVEAELDARARLPVPRVDRRDDAVDRGFRLRRSRRPGRRHRDRRPARGGRPLGHRLTGPGRRAGDGAVDRAGSRLDRGPPFPYVPAEFPGAVTPPVLNCQDRRRSARCAHRRDRRFGGRRPCSRPSATACRAPSAG